MVDVDWCLKAIAPWWHFLAPSLVVDAHILPRHISWPRHSPPWANPKSTNGTSGTLGSWHTLGTSGVPSNTKQRQTQRKGLGRTMVKALSCLMFLGVALVELAWSGVASLSQFRSSKPLSRVGFGLGGGFDSHALPPVIYWRFLRILPPRRR